MVEHGKTLSTGEFSQATGISVPTVSRMLRMNRLRGEKRSGKWAIYESEIQKIAVINQKYGEKASAGPVPSFNPQDAGQRTYDVDTFARMTYLTEKGVRQWLKIGRLSGSTDADGNILVDAANLDRPELQHLIRK